MERILIISLFLISQSTLEAQWRGLRLSSIGPREGLTMQVHSMVQDSTGYMYFGGSQGLVRYDGSSLESFTNIPGDSTTINPGEVYKMVIGKDNNIWLTLRYSGLDQFDPKTGTFKHFPLPRKQQKMEYGCDGLLEDDVGDIWTGGQHARIFRVNRGKDSLEMYFPDWIDQDKITRRYTISTIIQDQSDRDIFWLGVIDYVDTRPNQEIPRGYGLMSFNRKTKKFTSFPNAGRLSRQRADGTLLTTHLTEKVPLFTPSTGEVEIIPFKTSDYPKQYISRDVLEKQSEDWLMTAYEILEFDESGATTTIFKNQPDDPNFIGFALSNDSDIWLKTEQGVRIFDQKINQIEYFSLEQFGASDRIYPGRIAFDQNNNQILLAHHAGISNKRLYRIPLDPGEKRNADFINTEHATWGVTSDKKNNIWLSGGGNLYTLEGDQVVQQTKPGLSQFKIPWHWNMRTNSTGYVGIIPTDRFMWFHPDSGSMNQLMINDFPLPELYWQSEYNFLGFAYSNHNSAYIYSAYIFKVDLTNGEVQHLQYNPSFNPNKDEIYDVREDKNGFVWIASPMYLGKFKLVDDQLELIRSYTVNEGLAQSQVTELFIDYKNRIWCFTGSGLNCINEQENEVRYFGLNEGLPHTFTDPRQVIELPDHRIVTVNRSGLILFHPDSLWDSQSTESVDVVINEIRVDGIPVELNFHPNYLLSYKLPKGRHILDIRFQGLSFPNADQLKYSYRLDGLQNDWIDIGINRFVTFSGLSPGKYNFQVKAGSPNSNSPVKTIQIIVPTPISQQWWFLLLCGILIAGLIYLIYQYRVLAIKKEEEEKTNVNKKIAELELKALRSQMNPHFMFNSLNSIKNFILRSEKKEAAEYLSNFAHLIRLILQNSREKKISLQDELESLMLYIELEQLRFDDEFEFHCQIGEGVNMEQTTIPPMILQPYVENAIWHGLMHKKGKGKLSLSFEKCNSEICCIIEDDGVGREKALELKEKSIRKYKSMGMGITQDRIHLMNQMNAFGISVDVHDLKIDSDGKTGTRVTVRIPNHIQSQNVS